jgi:hypothetical protein
MSAKHEPGWYVFTPHGAESSRGLTAKIALGRYLRTHPGIEVMGIFREDLILKPPRGPGSPPYICMFNQGELKPRPNPEELEKLQSGKK